MQRLWIWREQKTARSGEARLHAAATAQRSADNKSQWRAEARTFAVVVVDLAFCTQYGIPP